MAEIGTTTPSKVVQKGTNATLRDLIFILFRRRWAVLVVALPIILIGGFSLFRQTSSFTAVSQVVVELAKVDLPKWNTSDRTLNYDRELSTLVHVAMSIPVGEIAAASLADSLDVIRELDPERMDLDEPEGLRDYILEKIDVSVVGESAILEFQYSSVNPRISLMVVGAMRDAFVQYQVHGRKNNQALGYYEEQISLVRAEIDSVLTDRKQLLKDTGYTSLKDDLRNDAGTLSTMEVDLYKATSNRKTMEAEYARRLEFLEGDPRDFPMGPEESRSHSLVYWRNTVIKHEDELNNLLAIHTDDSLPVRRQQDLIERALAGLKKEQVAFVESYRNELETARSAEQALLAVVAEVREKNSIGPHLYQKASLYDAEIGALREVLEDLQVKRGEVRINQLADERVSTVVRLSDPELIMVLTGGKTVVYFVMIVFFAGALGVVAAFVLESMDHRIYSPRDVEDNLKLPVFASVTKVE